uniref:Large ribosomal subunit protein uL22m n=1 Tax=Trichuris muris TaxID=70415 RepID=A0A5S6QKP2_TRIMR
MWALKQLQLFGTVFLRANGCRRWKHDFVAPEWDPKDSKYGLTPEKWRYYDNVVWPPGCDDGKMPGVVFHCRENVKHSWRKMWYVCHLIRGLNIDDALAQLDCTPRKGALIMKEILLEAQRKASDEHCLHQKSNLWVAEAACRNSLIIKGLRRHARERWGIVHYRYCNVFVRLEEGKPDHETRFPLHRLGWYMLEKHVKSLRDRRIPYHP